MNTFVLWSGGCDSTLALLQALEEAEDYSVTTLPIEHPNLGPAKAKGEFEARTALHSKYLSKYKYYQAPIKMNHASTIQGSGSPQATLWIGSVMVSLPEKARLVMGYIRGDDFWHHKHEFERAAYYLHRLHHGPEGQLELSYPLEWFTKVDVLIDLKNRKIDYKDLWWCESDSLTPLNNPCGRCKPCRRFNEAKRLMSLELSTKGLDLEVLDSKEVETKENPQPLSTC